MIINLTNVNLEGGTIKYDIEIVGIENDEAGIQALISELNTKVSTLVAQIVRDEMKKRAAGWVSLFTDENHAPCSIEDFLEYPDPSQFRLPPNQA